MPLKLQSATGSITLIAEDGSGNANVTLPRAGVGSVSSLSDLSITSTAAEINTLDGFTGDVNDLNTVDVTTLGTVEASKVVTADANGDVTFPDNEKAIFGTGSDLQIYHTGSQSFITDAGTGGIRILADADVVIGNADNSERYADFNVNGSVNLRYDNVTKFSTVASGVNIIGELIADSYNETYAAVTSSSNATTVDCEAGNAFSHTLTENTTFTFSNPPASGTAYSFSIEIIQDASASGFVVTWPSSVDWPSATAPTLTATASAKDMFIFTTRDGGTTWYGFTAGQALG